MSRVERLPNGLLLALEERDYPGVAFHLLVPAGAVNEPEGLLGSSALLEGWLWKGAGELDAQGLAGALDALGVRRQSGAGLEYTLFSAAFLPEVLEEVFRLYALLLTQPRLPREAFEAVRSVALQSLLSQEDQPARKLFSELRRRVFLSAHGRDPLGQAEDLKGATPEAVRADFHRRYTPRGAILAVAGGVSWERLLAASEPFLAWEGEEAFYPPPRLAEPHRFALPRPTAQVQIGLAYPDVGPEDPGFYPARLALEVLSGGMSSRLFTEVREKRGLVYAVSAFPAGVRGQGLLMAYAGTTKERAQETLEVMLQEMERLAQGVTEEELLRAKVGLRTALVMADESIRSRASSMARDLFALGRVRSLSEIEGAIEGTDLGAVNAFLRAHPYRDPWVGLLGEVAHVS
ncbi:MAG: insulinase family protein [Thermus sp.]|uniref:M16 family metallopeptidase n=1 Tax=unclassified Thermus TaxID=2619321 RepID=UPI00059D1B30|nr:MULTISPECIES: pitrilysin family protein [unclassified Thermus]MCS6868407.1 insulinase family protein [Thermus sp.]MCS7218033.1 insulinase family protein [Thermus sp.]MCX7849798.1 insulinase family protein [Thermus sp.]MDW8017275.1 pitrilysin family protein [Thermus sp.]MDW8357751.1 pitrilysin family protein [Thermus sp.]